METIADRSRSATNNDVLGVEPVVTCIAIALRVLVGGDDGDEFVF